MIQFPCPGCQTIFKVTDDKAGKKGKCPKCQSPFTIPQPESAAAAPPPALKPDPNLPVEIEPCPGCQAVLTVAAEFLGADVECPNCQTVFTAAKPGAKPKPKPVAPPPPPPPPAPANAFANFDEPTEEEDEEPKPKKGKSKAKVDLDDEEDEAPRKKSKRPIDDEEADEEEDYERAGPTKGKAKKGKNGLLLAAGIIHIVFALLFMTCGGLNILGGSCLASLGGGGAAAGGGSSTLPPKNNPVVAGKGANNDQAMKDFEKEFEKAMKQSNDPALKDLNKGVKNLNMIGNIALVVGIGSVLLGIMAIVASIGCFTRKPFGKLATFAVGALAVLLKLVGILAPILLVSGDFITTGGLITDAIGLVVTAAYAGFTIFAVVKGFKKEAGGSVAKKKPSRDDEDEAEAEEEEEAAPPPPTKKGKKKVVEDDEEDDLPPPPKKKSGGNDFAFDDDEEEAPKPKKKKPRRDDDD